MTVQIENYRGFDISFNPETETFTFSLDDSKYNEKVSFGACKKLIDEYWKDNQSFEPFYVLKSSNMYDNADAMKIVGIRKDGRWVKENKDGTKEQVSDYHTGDWYLDTGHNRKVMGEMAILELQKDEIDAKKKEVQKKLSGETLKQLKNRYISPK